MKAEAVICGAGIAGIAVAWQLAVAQGRRNILLVDEGPPLGLTSDKSTECYRNWWPDAGAAMTALSNRSIDLMEQFAGACGNAIALDRRGYLFVSAEAGAGSRFEAAAHAAQRLGSGALRVHSGKAAEYRPAVAGEYRDQPGGADLLLGSEAILEHYPYLNPASQAALHVRRCGALSAQQLGMLMLEQARAQGLVFRRGKVTGIDCGGGRVQGVRIAFEAGTETIGCQTFINAAGPYLGPVSQLLGIDLPVVCERHIKLTFADNRAVVPRDAPLLLWSDPVTLPWSAEERELLGTDPEMSDLLEPLPAGVHGRPLGAGDSLMLYWTYDCPLETPQFPPPTDPHTPEILVRGMSVMVPGLAAYYEHIPRAVMDGGYYTKTPDNRPLIGPLPVAGAWVAGAYSGYGIMIAMAAGELLAAQICGDTVPACAGAFAPARFDDPRYLESLDERSLAGQM